MAISSYLILSIIYIENFVIQFKSPLRTEIVKLVTTISLAFLGINWVVSFPFYDGLACIFIELNILSIIQLIKKRNRLWINFSLLTSTLPFFAKQNTGIVYVAASITLIIYLTKKSKNNFTLSKLSIFQFILRGVSLPLMLFSYLYVNHAIKQFFYQTFSYAGKVKHLNIKSVLLSYYHPTFIVLVIICLFLAFQRRRIGAFHSVTTPILFGGIISCSVIVMTAFNDIYTYDHIRRPIINWLWILASLGSLVLLKRKINTSTISLLISVLLLFALCGNYLSQGFIGSFYGFGPLLALATILIAFENQNHLPKYISGLVISSLFLTSIWFLLYAESANRYSNNEFANTKFTFGSNASSNLNYLALPVGLAADYHNLEDFLRDKKGSIIEIPSEDPLRLIAPLTSAWTRCSQYFEVTCTLSISQIHLEYQKNPPNLIVEKNIAAVVINLETSTKFLRSNMGNYKLIFENDTFKVFQKKRKKF